MKKVEKIVVYLLMFMLCICASKLTAAADEPGEAVELTVYVKNSADWEVINVYAWDNHDGAATDMEWVETPMEDMGNGWRSYTLTGYSLDFFFCFQNGGSVWTNDVPVEPGMTEVYLDLKDETKGEKQVCQYTEERPGEEETAQENSAEGTPLTVYVKNSANWEVINVFAWDNYDGAATDMEWVETPMEDMGNGWRSYTLTGFNLDFFFCFQDGGSMWTNDVPVEPGMTEVYLDLKDETKGEKQVCQYTEERPGEEEPAGEPSSDSASDDSSSEQAGEEAEIIPVEAEKTSGISMVIPIIIVIVVVALVAAGICVYRVKGKKNK